MLYLFSWDFVYLKKMTTGWYSWLGNKEIGRRKKKNIIMQIKKLKGEKCPVYLKGKHASLQGELQTAYILLGPKKVWI